jgi:hypothetical protein
MRLGGYIGQRGTQEDGVPLKRIGCCRREDRMKRSVAVGNAITADAVHRAPKVPIRLLSGAATAKPSGPVAQEIAMSTDVTRPIRALGTTA